MPTFNELNERLRNAQYRKTVMQMLIEHIDESFCPHGGEQPKKVLLTDDKMRVPPEFFETVVEDTLNAEVKQLDAEIAQIQASEMSNEKKKQSKNEKQAQEAV